MKKLTLLLLISFISFHAFSKIGDNRDTRKNELGKNIISFSPMHFIISNIEDESPDLAVGFAYERIFNNDIFAFRLPASFSIREKYTYLMPTLKVYPTHQGQVRYSVGPQFLIGFGKNTFSRTIYDQGQYINITETINRKQLGFLINNGLNFTLAKHVYVGLDAGLGIKYYDNLPAQYNYYSSGLTPFSSSSSNTSIIFQINFNMGVRL